MSTKLGQVAPDFEQDTTIDRIRFHAGRVIDSQQLCGAHKVATPVNWRPRESAFIMGSVSDADGKERFAPGWETKKPHPRVVDLGKAAG